VADDSSRATAGSAAHRPVTESSRSKSVRGQLDGARGHFDNDLTSLRRCRSIFISARQSSVTNVRTVDDLLADAKRHLQIVEGRRDQRSDREPAGRSRAGGATDVGSIVGAATP